MKRTEISEKRKSWDTESRALIRAKGRYRKRFDVEPNIIKSRHDADRWRWIVAVP